MPNILIGRYNPYVVKAPLKDRLKCLLHGGHSYYFNTELGGFWCFTCGSARECEPTVSGK